MTPFDANDETLLCHNTIVFTVTHYRNSSLVNSVNHCQRYIQYRKTYDVPDFSPRSGRYGIWPFMANPATAIFLAGFRDWSTVTGHVDWFHYF